MTKSGMNPKVHFYFSKAKKWQEELEKLRMILLDCGLTAKARFNQMAEAAKTEREGRSKASIKMLQAWCPKRQEGCLLPVEEAYNWYEKARRTFAPTWENKMTSTSFQNLAADDPVFAIHLAKAPILIVHPDRDVVSVDDVLFYFKRAPEPKRLIVPGGLHTSTYVNGFHQCACWQSVAHAY